MKNESGRSMVEMLGVLAIIGVLSIGGIAGYTLAMNRYRANEAVNVMSVASIYGMTAEGGEGAIVDFTDSGGASKVSVKNTLGISAFPKGMTALHVEKNGTVRATFSDLKIGKLVGDILANKLSTGSGETAGDKCKSPASTATSCTVEAALGE